MGDLQKMRQRAADSDLGGRYERARARLAQSQQNSIDRRAKKREDEARRRQEAAIEAQRIAAQERRDKNQAMYGMAENAQRANYAADMAAAENQYSLQRDDRQQRGVLKRDDLQNRFQAAQDRQKALDLQRRDKRQFDFSQQDAANQFERQIQRDTLQNQFTNERDYRQFGYDSLREDQQQQDILEREQLQQAQQLERDNLLNQFSTQQDERQQQNILEREGLQQQFVQQNMYQREAADISAKWQDQVAQARNAGLDFSEKQKKEMQEMDEAFRKNVLNSDLHDTLKQQAMVEHQKKLSAIIPNEKVQNPKDMLDSSIMFHEPTQTWFTQQRDARGLPVFEPLSSGKVDTSLEDKAMKQTEQQQTLMRKAEFERLDKFNELVDRLATSQDPETGELMYKGDAVMEEALKRFAPYEARYQSQYQLPPFEPYQEKAAREQQKQQEQAKAQASNPWRQIAGQTPQPTQQPGMQNPPVAQPMVMSSALPLPKEVVQMISRIPAGDELIKLREKHGSKSQIDMTIRMAADIVLNSLATGDTSDPDLAEAQSILEKSGYSAGKK